MGTDKAQEFKGLRFDDMIATVLDQPRSDTAARATAWRQLVDLIAQARDSADPTLSDLVYDRLSAWRDHVPVADRLSAARSLAQRRLSIRLVRYFAVDQPDIALSLLGSVRLTEPDWLSLLPDLPPSALAVLRLRTDLGNRVALALAGGANDDDTRGQGAAPPWARGTAENEDGVAPAGSQIQDLMSRIASFRSNNKPLPVVYDAPLESAMPLPLAMLPADQVERFDFGTNGDGVIIQVEGAPRGRLIGLSIAAATRPGLAGVDPSVADAWQHQAPFADGRLTVAGHGGAAGNWEISGQPVFDAASGAFDGYRGTALRRRMIDRVASGATAPAAAPDALRQLAHDLDLPLNAIINLGEVISAQQLGPLASSYRDRAGTIVEQARQILGAVEELDIAARLERDGPQAHAQSTDSRALIAHVIEAVAPIVRNRGAHIAVVVPPRLPMLAVDEDAAERMMRRLIGLSIGLAGRGERIVVEASAIAGLLALQVGRPASLAGRSASILFDPADPISSPNDNSEDKDDGEADAIAELSGFAFSLRLVRRLAIAARGDIDVTPEHFILKLPLIRPMGGSRGAG